MTEEKRTPGQGGDPAGPDTPAMRIMDAWTELEAALRDALPVCAVAPPTQPSELLAALRINHQIGPAEEARILALREARNQAAYSVTEAEDDEAIRFEREVKSLIDRLPPRVC